MAAPVAVAVAVAVAVEGAVAVALVVLATRVVAALVPVATAVPLATAVPCDGDVPVAEALSIKNPDSAIAQATPPIAAAAPVRSSLVAIDPRFPWRTRADRILAEAGG